jgi:thiol-disulfide isomerase/thioredoxin
MRAAAFCIFIFYLLLYLDCRPAAPPISVSNRPVTTDDRSSTNLPLPPSKPLAEMSWTDGDGRVQKLSDLGGKAVILDFWATYCPPCRQEIPHLNALIAKHGRENLEIVGLNVGGDEDKPEIPQFVASTKIDYPIAFPETELTRFIFATRDDIPQTAVFDRKGTLVTKIIGFSPDIQKELDAAVEEALKTE